MKRSRLGGARAIATCVVVVLLGASGARAQSCNDGNECTDEDMCVDGACRGTPTLGASCDASSELVNGVCAANGSETFCRGERPPAGSTCQRGCGTLEVPFPGSGDLVCVVSEAMIGQPCTIDPCRVGVCERIAGPFSEGMCGAQPVQCPDTDGDPCTREFCNSETGECQQGFACHDACETCDPETGACAVANVGAECNDGNPCTVESICEALDIPELGVVGRCVPPGTAPTPTPTTAPSTPTPTLALPVCVGDCNRDRAVTVDELVTGVNIALGERPNSDCPSFDTSGHELVEVDELVGAIENVLSGCPTQ